MTKYAKDYTLAELLVTAAAKEIQDGEVMFVGVGIPILAGMLAKYTHAPNHTQLMEWGSVDASPRRLMFCVSCTTGNERSYLTGSQRDNMADAQNGHVDACMLGSSQVDKYGNINTTFLGGTYESPKVRLPGSGGANDLASSIRRVIILARDIKRTFVNKLDYLTSPGYLSGPGDRERLGMPGGPVSVITPKGIFRFDKETKEMFLDTIHPGVKLEDIVSEVPWELKIQDPLRETEPPTEEHVNIIRTLDPEGIYIGKGRETMSGGGMEGFYKFLEIMDKSYEPMNKLITKNT